MSYLVNLIIALMPRHNGFVTGLSVRNLNVLTVVPKKLLDNFIRHFPEAKKPSDSTGDLILACAGLKRRMSADTQPFGECIAPNATWSADFKG